MDCTRDEKDYTTMTSKESIELRRWCIEMAVKWPVLSHGGYGQMAGGRAEDQDVIGRATKILDWVKAGS